MEIQAASRSEKAALGQGYDTSKEEFVGQGVRGDTEYAGNQEARLSFDRSMDESSMTKEFGLEVGAKARYGLFSGSLAAQFASESASSEYSDATIYKHVITFKNAKLRIPDLETALTPEGRSARGTSDGNLLGENWRQTCGDQFVSQITLGAKLLISVKVEFATREEKRSFGMQFSLKGPPLEVSANLRSASAKYGKRAAVSIQAYQLGGDVRKLSQIFGTTPGNSPILTASLENPEGVLSALAAAVAYGKDEFPAQINPAASIDSATGPAQLSYITSPWEELGLYPRPLILDASVQNARRLLSEAFERHAANQRRVSRMLYGPIRLSPRQLERAKQMQLSLARNLTMIHEAAIVAYTDFQQAVSKVNEVLPALEEFLPEEFDIQPESFAQWWDLKDLPDTLREHKRVVDEMAAQLIPDFNDFAAIEDKGLALQQRLAQIDDMPGLLAAPHWLTSPVWSVMADSGIERITLPQAAEDLKPALMLKKLRELNVVTSLLIRDLSGVERLRHLEVLSLAGPVQTLAPLTGHPSLIDLSLMRNDRALAGDLSPLATIPTLRKLALSDTGVRDPAVLAGLRLESLGLTREDLTTVKPLASIATLREVWLHSGSPIPDITELAAHPRLSNLFLSADRITVTFDESAPQTWTRRGKSNVFDITTDAGPREGDVATLFGIGPNYETPERRVVWISVVMNGTQRSINGELAPDVMSGPWMGGEARGQWRAVAS